jgi:hypothetical protein
MDFAKLLETYFFFYYSARLAFYYSYFFAFSYYYFLAFSYLYSLALASSSFFLAYYYSLMRLASLAAETSSNLKPIVSLGGTLLAVRSQI